MQCGGNNCIKLRKCVKYILDRYCSTSVQNNKPAHIPVMKNEVLEHLNLSDGNTVLDMTFGAGGHTRTLLEKFPNLKIIALDRDPLAYEYANELEKERPGQIKPLLGRFSQFPDLARKEGIGFESVDAVIFDLGASSMQMDLAERGFALSKVGPLDMRMDGTRYPDSITAADVVNYASEEDLYRIFKVYGEEKQSRLFARSIVQTRITYKHFSTTKDLADLTELVGGRMRLDKLERRAHCATKVFQALRIFVNNEINELNHGLVVANFYLKLNGRIAVLSFHSLEDTLVKSHFQGHIFSNDNAAPPSIYKNPNFSTDGELDRFSVKPWNPVNKKVITPKIEEIIANPRSRSAHLRVAEKISTISKSDLSDYCF